MKHLYRSIAAYRHEVFKYAGQFADDQLDFWINHLSAHGATDDDPTALVLVLDERPGDADRITFNPALAEKHYKLGYAEGGIFLADAAVKEAK